MGFWTLELSTHTRITRAHSWRTQMHLNVIRFLNSVVDSVRVFWMVNSICTFEMMDLSCPDTVTLCIVISVLWLRFGTVNGSTTQGSRWNSILFFFGFSVRFASICFVDKHRPSRDNHSIEHFSDHAVNANGDSTWRCSPGKGNSIRYHATVRARFVFHLTRFTCVCVCVCACSNETCTNQRRLCTCVIACFAC